LDENLEGENYQNFLSPYPHEVEDSMNDTPCQNIDLFDPSFDDVEGVKCEEGLVDSPSFHEKDENLDDLFYIGRHDWDVRCFYFEGDPVYDTEYEGEDVINELGHSVEFNLEIPDEKSTSPSLEEHEVIFPPLHERVKYERVGLDMEHSLPCALEILPLTYECPHPPCLFVYL
jgi:hypothetical protein